VLLLLPVKIWQSSRPLLQYDAYDLLHGPHAWRPAYPWLWFLTSAAQSDLCGAAARCRWPCSG
jgi:hypothetical protein